MCICRAAAVSAEDIAVKCSLGQFFIDCWGFILELQFVITSTKIIILFIYEMERVLSQNFQENVRF